MRHSLSLLALAIGLALHPAARAAPVGTAFTYQGELRVAGTPTSAVHDFEFVLYIVASGGVAIASVTRNDVGVAGGVFTVELDFTEVPFAAAEAYWLEVRVRDGASAGGYTTLTPRQRLTPVPYAINARSVPAGAIGSAQLAVAAVSEQHLRSQSIARHHLRDHVIGAQQLEMDSVGSAQVANASLGPQDLASDAIGSSHVQDASLQGHDLAPRAIGASQLALGAVDEAVLAPAAVLTQHLAADAVDGGKVLDGSITSSELADGSVGSLDLAPGAVRTVHLADGAVGSHALLDSSVTTSKLSVNAVDTHAIADGQVGTADLASAAVDESNLRSGAVTTTKIAAGAVTRPHLAPDSVGAEQIADGSVAAVDLAFVPGDVTAVHTGFGLIGGGSSGELSLLVDLSEVQARVDGNCPVGQYFRGIEPDGGVRCEPVPGVPSITTLLDAVGDVGADLSMALGADGAPVIAYRAAHPGALSRLEVRKCFNSACLGGTTFSVVDDPANAVGFDTAIAVGPDGLPAISYHDFTAQALKIARCTDPACVAPAVIHTVDDDAGSNLGRYSSIAVGSDNLPAVSYWDATGGRLKLMKCRSATCAGLPQLAIVDDPVNSTGIYSSLALDAGNLPFIAHRDESALALRVSKCSTVNCDGSGSVTSTNIDDPANDVGSHPAVAIGADGNPMIAYRDNTAGALKVLLCANASCTSATVSTLDDTANALAVHSAIAIGSDSLAVVAYQDGSAGALKVAKCANTACTAASSIVTVDDPPGVVGAFVALRLGHDGLPVMVHQDVTQAAIKAVKCGTRSCQ